MKATILFFDELNDETKQVVETASDAYLQGIENGTIAIYVEKTDEKKQTTEMVRTLAGNIARTLQKQTVETVQLNDQVLVNSFSQIDAEEVIVAFVEGWHL